MTEGREYSLAPAQAGTPAADEWGWYLYGITRRSASATTRPERGDGAGGKAELALDAGADEGEPVQVLACGALAAIVRRVPLAQFSEEALRARHDDTAWFATMARRHNEVIAAIHQQQAVLPAKFGSIYARAEDVKSAVAEAQETLLAQLECVEGCDEWAVLVYAHRPAVEHQQAPGQRTPGPGQQLERLGRLHGADHADQRREHAHGAAGGFLDLAIGWEQAGVAG